MKPLKLKLDYLDPDEREKLKAEARAELRAEAEQPTGLTSDDLRAKLASMSREEAHAYINSSWEAVQEALRGDAA
jgi:hypothetical protein